MVADPPTNVQHDQHDPADDRPFAAVALIVIATQAFYVFYDTKYADPDVWPLWGLLAGAAAWFFLRPVSLASAGYSRKRLGAGLRTVAVLIAATFACLAIGRLLGAFEVATGVNRLAPDQIPDLLLRLACFYGVALLGDELAFRSILQSESIRRYGPTFGLVLVAVLFAVYRVPYAVRVGLVDVRPESFETDRMILVLLKGLIDGLALGLLFRMTRNLFATAAYGWFLLALPALGVGNAEDPLEPMWFLVERNALFDGVLWASAIVPLALLAITSRYLGAPAELPELSTPEWITRNASFSGGTPTDP